MEVQHGVDYSERKSWSLVDKRTHHRYHATEIGTLETNGSDGIIKRPTTFLLTFANREYLNTWGSWLRVKTKFLNASSHTVSTKTTVKDVAWYSLIQCITLVARDGKEIERIDNFHRYAHKMLPSILGKEYLTCFGSFTDKAANINTYVGGEEEDIALIPLPCLTGLFRVPQLLPPHMLDGLIIRIDWTNINDFYTVFTTSAATPIDNATNFSTRFNSVFTIEEATLLLDTITLSKVISDAVDTQYATSGLIISYKSTLSIAPKHHPFNTNGENIVYAIKDSFSRACNLLITGNWEHNEDYIVVPGVPLVYYDPRQFYSTYSNQTSSNNLKYYAHYNGVSYPNHPIEAKSEGLLYWFLAFNKERLFNDNMDTSLSTSWKAGTMGDTIMINLQRCFANAHSTVTDSNYGFSGLRVDGERPLNIFMQKTADSGADIPQPPSGLTTWADGIDASLQTHVKWTKVYYLFMDHMRNLRISHNSGFSIER